MIPTSISGTFPQYILLSKDTFCSMYRLGFQVSQRSLRQPGWGGATAGLGSRAHSVGGSSFTARRGVIGHFLCFILQGSVLASPVFLSAGPFLLWVSIRGTSISSRLSLCLFISVLSCFCRSVSVYEPVSLSVSYSCPRAFALVVPSVWSTYLPNIQCLAPSFPPRIFSNVVFSVRPSLTAFSPAVPTPSPA